MPCYSPLRAWRGPLAPSGKQPLVFKRPPSANAPSAAYTGGEGQQLELPCGQCIGCRLERSRQWALRCVDEASLWPRNCFITLTYAAARLPSDGSVHVEHFQLFMKRLRQDAVRSGRLMKVNPIRFFACAEYGEKLARPHYHACLFNYDFDDKKFFRSTSRGDVLYRSPTLEKLWDAGHSLIGEVSFESAAYVARYITKKITGGNADEHYVNKITGEVRSPERVLMSRGGRGKGFGGIGRGWFDRFKSDIYPRDRKIVKGLKLRPPRYYDSLYDIECPEVFKSIKEKRFRKGLACAPDNTYDRLRVKEEVKKAQLSFLRRSLEVE